MIKILFIGLLFSIFVSAAFVTPIIDETGFFSAEENSHITHALEKLRTEQDVWMVVHTAASSGGNIDSYAENKFEQLQVGEAGRNNGLLLVIIPSEKAMRLEVGYGLEGTFTDSISRRLLDEILRPHFRANQNAQGVLELIAKINSISLGSEKEWLAHAPQEPDQTLPFSLRLLAMVASSSAIMFLCVRHLKKESLQILKKISAEAPELDAAKMAPQISATGKKSFIVFLILNAALCVAVHRFVPPLRVTALELFVGAIFGLFISAFSTFLALKWLEKGLRRLDQRMDAQLSAEAQKRVREMRTTLRLKARKSRRSRSSSSSSKSGGGSMRGGGRSGGGGASSNW